MSAVIKALTTKFGEKLRENERTLSEKFAYAQFNNEMLALRMDAMKEYMPIINDTTQRIRVRVATLDALIQVAGTPWGMSDPVFSWQKTLWNLIVGGWDSRTHTRDLSEYFEGMGFSKTEEIVLGDGTRLVIDWKDKESYSVLSDTEREDRIESYGRRDMLPYGKITFDHSFLKEDKSPQFIASMQGVIQEGQASKQIVPTAQLGRPTKTAAGLTS